MAEYKVPQDVEAEDKLIGWLSFRQLIYVGIAAVAAVLAFFLFRMFPPLVIIPLPIVFLFGILSLPLRKDQPLETYLLAVVRFYFKPRTRRWDPDGTVSYVEITAPKLVEQHLSKDYGAEAAQQRLDYLARIMDSRGWAFKGATPSDASINQAVVSEANNAVDVLDENANLSRSFQGLLDQQKEQRLQRAREEMQRAQENLAQARHASPLPTAPVAPININYNPYPSSMHQKVVLPIEEQQAAAKHAEDEKRHRLEAQKAAQLKAAQISPALVKLATSSDNLSVSAIAHEAQRLTEQNGMEVDIKLR